VLDEEVVCRAWLATDVVEYRTELRVDVRHLVEHAAKPSQIVRMPTHVCCDERRIRVTLEQVVALRHEIFERRPAGARPISSVAEQRQLEPPFIVEIDRLKEFLRLGRMNEDRNLQSTRRFEDWIEL